VEHPKDIGDRSTLAVMAALQMLGYGLYVPFGENTRCDLILESNGELSRVQCKTGRLRKGAVVFSLCSHYGHHANPKTARRTYHGEIDFFAVYCPETNGVYLLPIEDVPGRRQAWLRVDPPRNQQNKRVRPAARYEIAKVTTEGLRASSGA
jgi:PD-(D/E)XK endonuclease